MICIPNTTDCVTVLDHQPLFTFDGDKTVVIPSATSMGTITPVMENLNTYYVDIKHHNRIGGFNRNRKHADILEIDELIALINEIIKEVDPKTLSDAILEDKPTPKPDDPPSLRVSVRSPVSVDVFDTLGNHTGLILNPDPNSDLTRVEEAIPNSYYMEFGEGKYIGIDTADTHRIELQGLETGIFTLEIEAVLGDTVLDTATWSDVPVTPDTKAVVVLQTLASSTPLSLDIDGDGTEDFLLKAGDEIGFDVLFAQAKHNAVKLSTNLGIKQHLSKQLELAEKFITRNKLGPAHNILNSLSRWINTKIRIGQIDSFDGAILSNLIERIISRI